MSSTRTDVVVVGAGSAGCVVAARLSERPSLDVTVLEAGPDFAGGARPAGIETPRACWDPNYYWAYEGVVAPNQPPLFVIRGRVIGGSGAINGTSLVRGLPEDFDAWGSPQWRWPEVLRAYVRLETDLDFGGEHHGQDGPIPIRRHPREEWGPFDVAFYEAGREWGFPASEDLNGPNRDGIGAVPRNMRDGKRVDTALAYLEPARARENLRVLGDGYVRRILWDGNRAVGVEYERHGEVDRIEAGEVILTAGGIESPHLLFLSGVGAADDLRAYGLPVVADLPGVGKNLQDHPTHRLLLRPVASAIPDERLPSGPVSVHFTTEDSEIASDLQFTLLTLPASPLTDPSVTFACILNHELSVGELRFVSGDPADRPRIEYHYLEHPEDRRRARAGVRTAMAMTRLGPFQTLIEGVDGPPDEVLASDRLLDEWLVRNVQTAYHSMGTCKLGPAADRFAVVDDYCRVHGVDGVRVVDLSIVPNIVRANAFGTAVVAGERAAELIAEQLA